MKTEGHATDRYIRTFIRGLGKNRLGQNFMKVVCHSQQRNRNSSLCNTTRKHKIDQSQEKSFKKKRIKTQINLERDIQSFKIKQNSLGESVGVAEFSLNREDKTSKPEQRVRARALTRQRNYHPFNSLVFTRKESLIAEYLRRRGQWIKINNVDKILTTLVPNQIVSTLRIYKQRLKKFYTTRYRRQKITSFFDYEYIEDYDSQMGYLETLLSLKLQQIYYLCFLVLDQNSDGLICNNDLFSLATASTKENPLINKDIYTIYQYVSQQQKKLNHNIVDMVSNEEHFKPDQMNLQKYRIKQYKLEKEKEKQNKKIIQDSAKYGFNLVKSMKLQPQTSKVTRKTHKHLFSFMKQQQEGEQAIRNLRKRLAENSKIQSRSNYRFKINFAHFKDIFSYSLPETYFDVLYSLGGIEVPGKKYLPLNFDIDQFEKKQAIQLTIDRYGMFQERLINMRKTYRKSRIQRLSTGFLSGY